LLDRYDEEAQRLIEELGIDAYPAYIFNSSVTETARFEDMQIALMKVGDYYIIIPEASGAVLFDNAPVPDDDPIKGDPEAPVTIIEFSDFECPYCASFNEQTLSIIDERYIRTGIANLVYRDNPSGSHPEAKSAAIAANCAREQDGDKIYFKMHDLIYENQMELGEISYRKWAGELDLDIIKFEACLSSGRYVEEVNNDIADAAAVGISATPSFFIGNIRITGAQPLSVFERAIQAEMETQSIKKINY
jgi:protein-disulfide isomerase